MITVLTGATGFLGRELLSSILARDPDEQVVVAVRAGHGRSATQRVDDLLTTMYGPRAIAMRARVHPFEADLTADAIELPPALRERIAGERCRVIHGAASVSFDLPLAAARAVNVDGTRRMLALAESLSRVARLERFAYVSTAFVAGARDGVVREEELEVGQRFTNTYEQTKREAEALVQSWTGRVPVTVFRPSIVAGHSETGFTSSFKVLYWPLRAFARRLVLCIPGDPDARFDIVPVDFVVEGLLHIVERPDSVGRCYHLTAGRGITLRRAVELAASFFGVRRVPPFVSPNLFWALVYPVLFVTLTGRKRDVLDKGRLYIPYLGRRLVFDNRHTLAALDGTGLAPPDIEQYLLRLFNYLRDTDWGKRSPESAPARVQTAVEAAARLDG